MTIIGHNFGQPSASKTNYEDCPDEISLQEIKFEKDLTWILTSFEYKPQILGLKNEKFALLLHMTSTCKINLIVGNFTTQLTLVSIDISSVLEFQRWWVLKSNIFGLAFF